MWKRDVLLNGLGDRTKVWIVFGRLPYGVLIISNHEQVQSYRCLKLLSAEFFETAYV
jgi:hypothetical protein